MSGKAKKPSQERLRKWRHSFAELLSDSQGFEQFREFLRSEYSDDNLEFWHRVEQYRRMSQAPGVQRRQVASEARRIYVDFVAASSPHQINIDVATRQLSERNCFGERGFQRDVGPPGASPDASVLDQMPADATSFDEAQRKIVALMERDSFRRFLDSPYYQQLLK